RVPKASVHDHDACVSCRSHRGETGRGDTGTESGAAGERNAMIQRLVRQFFYEVGNGRALENARRATEHGHNEHERIEAAVRAIVSDATEPPDRHLGAA